MRVVVITLYLSAIFLSSSLHASNGLLGTTNIKVFIGKTFFKDDKVDNLVNGNDVLVNNILYGLRASYQVSKNISIGIGSEGMYADIEYDGNAGYADATYIDVEALYHFFPSNFIDPFISIAYGLEAFESKIEFGGGSIGSTKSDTNYRYSIGAEFDLNNKVFITPSYTYINALKYNNMSEVKIELNTEIYNNIYIGAVLKHDMDVSHATYVDDTHTSCYVNLGYKF